MYYCETDCAKIQQIEIVAKMILPLKSRSKRQHLFAYQRRLASLHSSRPNKISYKRLKMLTVFSVNR
jgi:hypothetical protein